MIRDLRRIYDLRVLAHEENGSAFDSKERDRRQKWLRRQIARGNHGLTIFDAPPKKPEFSSPEFEAIGACPDCDNFLWDLDDETLKRFCSYCAGIRLTRADAIYNQILKMRRKETVERRKRRARCGS